MVGRAALGFVLGVILTGCESGTTVPPESVSLVPAESAPSMRTESAASTPPAVSSGEIVARYETGVVDAEELTRALQRLPRRSLEVMNEQGRRRFVENQVLNKILYEEAKTKGLDQDSQIQEQVEELERRLVVQKLIRELQDVPPISSEAIEEYYREHESSYSTTTLRARHILVREEELAEEILAEVEADPTRFAELAEQHSIDTASARKGGDLGFFGHGRMVPEFEAAAFSLQEPGDLSDVVKSQYGYHIIVLEERREGPVRPLDQVRERIRATLHQDKVRSRTQSYYDGLRERSNLEIDEAALDRVLAELPKASGAGGGLNVHSTGGH